MKHGAARIILIAAIALQFGCSGQSQKSQYLLAERLWSDGNFAAAVAAFEKAANRDPKSKMGVQSLFRAASTQLLYLNQPTDAIQKLIRYSELTPDPQASWEALLQVGDIYYSKLDQSENAIKLYQSLLKKREHPPEEAEIRYRIARSYYLLSRFKESSEGFEEIMRAFPKSKEAERAELDLGSVSLAQAESGTETYQRTIQKFQKFISTHPDSRWISEARFGIASALAEIDRLDEAEEIYLDLLKSYPAPQVIQIKLARLRERKAQKRR